MSTVDAPTLERGKALVLFGPQGCGKTRLAHQIVKGLGPIVETDVSVLANERETLSVLNRRPMFWIIDGLPTRIDAQARLKALVANSEVQMRGRIGQHTVLPTPHIIFCTSDVDCLGSMGNRRFTVFHVAGGGLTQ